MNDPTEMKQTDAVSQATDPASQLDGENRIGPSLQDYGDNFQAHLLDQYKMFVEMADRISVRRGQANTFYISLLSALIALLSLLIEKKVFSGSQSILLLFTSILGLTLCFTWFINVRSYKQLNGLKYKVIQEMEKDLPFPCYSREWNILKDNPGKKAKYTRLTFIESFVPIIFAIQYLGLFILFLASLVVQKTPGTQ